MFYSHEILTSRQHGVATIWLVATLGSKSNLKKVTRKAILDVDVSKACDTIVDPAAPMALRLQGNLLYGVSRVFSQQCNYLLHDTQATRDRWKSLTKVAKDIALDPDAGKARREQLNLPDDPGFNLELAFDFEFDPSDLVDSADMAQKSSLLSLPSYTSSQSGRHEPAFTIPSSVSPGSGGYGLDFPGDVSSALHTGSIGGRPDVLQEESGLLPDPGFYFDENGEEVQGPAPQKSMTPLSARPESRVASDAAIAQQVRQEHEAGMQGARQDVAADPFAYDDGVLALGDDILPQAEPFAIHDSDRIGEPQPELSQLERQSTSIAEAPQRRRRLKITISDERPELLNKDLAQWNDDYLANMADASRVKQQHKIAAQAKKNASFWVIDQGIGEVGAGLGQGRHPGPLEGFSGEHLLSALLGGQLGRKHARSTSPEPKSDESLRRVRARGEQEVARGDNDLFDEGIGHEFAEDIEIGREARPSLPDDHSSQMPWNVSSRAGSSQILRTAVGGLTSSVGGPVGGMDITSFPHQRSGSRHPSASPLFGRGPHRMSSIEIPDRPIPAVSESSEEGLDLPAIENDDFQLYGPAAAVSTQQAAESQWVRAALDSEANNFLGFVAERLESDSEKNEVTFGELLPPNQNRAIVAAQGLLHVLSLATKGLILVNQPEAFGDITISVSGDATSVM